MDSNTQIGDEFSKSELVISTKINDLEKELENLRKNQEEIKKNNNLTSGTRWNSIFFLIILIILVSIPSILVFLDRWLNVAEVRNYSKDFLCKITFLCLDGLPGYFFWVIVFLIISAMVAIVYGDSFSPFIHIIFRIENKHQREPIYKVNKFLLFSIGLLIFEIILNILINRIPGAELLVIIVLFYIYFLNQEDISIKQTLLEFKTNIIIFLKENYLLITTILISFIFLYQITKDYYQSFGQLNWIYFILFISLMVLIIKQFKKLPPLYWISIFIIIIYSYQMDNWLYTKIGDEYAFFFFSKGLSDRTFFWLFSNIFSLNGVYGTHSILSSIISNILMRFFGFNHYGWHFSNYLLIISSIIFFYLFFKNIFDKKIALLSILFLSFSSYLIGFSRIGYNNLQALFFVSITLWISGKFIRNGTISNAFLLGISTGLLLYSFQAAYFYIPVVFIMVIIFYPPKSKKNFSFYLTSLLGFLVLILPILFQPEFMKILNQGTFFNKDYLIDTPDAILLHLRSNFVYSILSYLYLFKESHFVASSMIDPITAIFLFIGLLIAIRYLFKEKFLLFLVISYLFLIFSIGMIHDYPAPPITRLFIVLPWVYCLSSIGIFSINKIVINSNFISEKWLKYLNITIIGMIILVNFLLSSTILQKRYSYFYFEPVVFKVMQYNTENSYKNSNIPESYLFLTAENYDLNWMNMLQDVYSIPQSKAQFHRIIYESEGISEIWNERIVNDENLFIFAPTSFSEDIIEKISIMMKESGMNLCQLRYRKDSPILAYMWMDPKKQFVCDNLFNF